MAWMQLAGMGMSMLSSYMGKKSQADQIEAQNEANRLQHEQNKALTAEMLSTLDERVSRAEDEAVRTSLRQKMQIAKAAHLAEGEATVRAAQMGGGAGRRASLATFRPAQRVAGDLETDANINLQTELTNLAEHYNDTAAQAIANLNNNAPILGTPPGTGEMLMAAGGAGLSYWNSMSDASKAQVKGMFKISGSDPEAVVFE